jgi:hypothetical protein
MKKKYLVQEARLEELHILEKTARCIIPHTIPFRKAAG